MLKKKDLEIFLSQLRDFRNPKEELEQWSTPPEIASIILFTAYSNGDIYDKVVADLGSGTGILSIGAALLGAKKVIGIEKDPEAHKIALENLEITKQFFDHVEVVFLCIDVKDFSERVDTVIMNPPFGLERGTRHADLIFLKKAFEIADKVYSLHHSSEKSRRFLHKTAKEYGFRAYLLDTFSFPLKAKSEKHRKNQVIIYTDFFLYEKIS